MHRINLTIISCFFSVALLYSQSIDVTLDRIYDRAVQDQNARQKMEDYSYLQTVHFIKRDGDGDIEEQSQRIFRVYIRPPDMAQHVLLKALDFKDDEWQDVTSSEKKKTAKSESQQFSLSEMVAPAMRPNYVFTIRETGNEQILHLAVEAVKKSEDRFEGDLWFRRDNYALVKAALSPSDTPTGVDSMRMIFELDEKDGYLLPSRVYLEAHISFLFFFRGSIETTINFSEYRMNQSVPDSANFNKYND